MADSVTKDTELTKLVDFVEDYLEATTSARELSEKSRDYFDGYQWTREEKNKLNNRKQPAITNNRVKPKIQFLKGMETQTRTDPKAYPREPNDDKAGGVSTDALRYVNDNNMSDQKFSDGFQAYLVESTEGHEVIVEFKNGKFEVAHNELKFDRLFWDPHSREKDFTDARYLGTKQWMDRDEAKEDYPDAPDGFFTFEDSGEDGETFDDKPSFFIDKENDRIGVFFIYYIKKGVWNYAIFSKGGFALTPRPSPYLDEDGNPEPQFIFQSAFVDRENRRYGEAASYLDMQDEINKRRSKFLHNVSVRQTFSNKTATGDMSVNDIKKELAKPDGHIQLNTGEFGKDFGVIPTGDMAAGQFTMLQEAKQEIDSVGANAALSGTDERQLSGRALQSLQQGGVVELGSLFDGHRYCKVRVWRAMFNRIKQYWTEERWVRVVGDGKDIKFTGLNVPVTLGDQIKEEFGEIPPELQGDPRLNAVVKVDNPVNELDVDIIIDESVDTVTLQQEQFDMLAKLYQANPNAIPFDLVVKASQLRNKDELIEMMKGGTEEQREAIEQQQQQEQAEQKQIIKAGVLAEIDKDKASAEKDRSASVKNITDAKQTAVETALTIGEATI